jgi:glycosyltransferase involved in cell wall biosynthesis
MLPNSRIDVDVFDAVSTVGCLWKSYLPHERSRIIMKLLVALEHHFVRRPDGVFTDLAFGYDYWQEYLEIFDEVIVMARINFINDKPTNLQRADGWGVKFFDISNYYGINSFLYRFPTIFFQAGKAIGDADCYLLRAGNIGMLAWFWLLLKRKKYACESMGHIREAIITERGNNPFYWSISLILHLICRLQFSLSECASYTSKYLRKNYPTRKDGKSFVFSGVRLTADVITAPRPVSFFKMRPFRFLSIGRLERQKGHLWLVQSAAELEKKGSSIDWKLDIVGPGSQLIPLRETVELLGLQDRVRIIGGVTWGEELFSYIDRSQLFVLPSLTEGMPRSLIEAMARGLPAIGSKTGGIPELIPKKNLVTVGDVKALAAAMEKTMIDPISLGKMSTENFKRAQDYKVEVTKANKLSFWKCILNCAK